MKILRLRAIIIIGSQISHNTVALHCMQVLGKIYSYIMSKIFYLVPATIPIVPTVVVLKNRLNNHVLSLQTESQ